MATGMIPTDVIYAILIILPVKSLLRFKCVCKEWYVTIESPDFIKSHLNRSIETNSNCSFIITYFCNSLRQIHGLHRLSPATRLSLPETFRYDCLSNVIGSCNGLICLNGDPAGLILCNPSTRRFQILPQPHGFGQTRFDLKDCPYYGYGIGYDSEGDDYKIVVILLHKLNDVLVYSLKANSWSRAQSPTTYHPYSYVGTENSTFLNNHLHWFCSKLIYRFDLHNYTWARVLKLPNCIKDGYYGWNLGVFDGCLCLSPYSYRVFDVWVLKEYGVEESWTHLFNILDHSKSPSACSDRRSLFRYNSREGTIEEFKVSGVPDVPALGVNCGREIKFCVESLVPLLNNDKLQGTTILRFPKKKNMEKNVHANDT